MKLMKIDEIMLPFASICPKSDFGDGIQGIHTAMAAMAAMVALSTWPGWPEILPDFQVFLAGNRWSNALLRRANLPRNMPQPCQ